MTFVSGMRRSINDRILKEKNATLRAGRVKLINARLAKTLRKVEDYFSLIGSQLGENKYSKLVATIDPMVNSIG